MTDAPAHNLTVEDVAIDELRPHPENPRRGDVDLLVESLSRLGQYRPVIANRGSQTGRPNEILAGHHIVQAARQLGWPSVKVSWVDVDETTGRRVLAVDNRASERGTFDPAELYDLLSQLPDLDASGYSPVDLDDLAIEVDKLRISVRDTVIVDDGPGEEPDPKFDFSSPWKNADRRIMVLDVPVTVFVWLQDELRKLAEERGLDSNTAVVLALVADATGSEIPAHELENDDAASA